MAPDQAPEAEQELASVEDQVSVEEAPLKTDVGFAASDTVGTGGVEPPELAPDPGALAPPHAANARASKGTSSDAFIRDMGIPIPWTSGFKVSISLYPLRPDRYVR
ncbi:MAG TPA: hypothetical protein VK635_10920 [Bradyrhizobium sp.]|nr:hypothetical protein [Bradyrhizobium sp.]